MCDALWELMKDEIDAEVKKQVQEKINAEVESAVEITKKAFQKIQTIPVRWTAFR